jgi:hypothetical protein
VLIAAAAAIHRTVSECENRENTICLTRPRARIDMISGESRDAGGGRIAAEGRDEKALPENQKI